MRLRFWRKKTQSVNPCLPYGIREWWQRLVNQNLVPPLTDSVSIVMRVNEPIRINYGCFADRRVFNDELLKAIVAGTEVDYAI